MRFTASGTLRKTDTVDYFDRALVPGNYRYKVEATEDGPGGKLRFRIRMNIPKNPSDYGSGGWILAEPQQKVVQGSVLEGEFYVPKVYAGAVDLDDGEDIYFPSVVCRFIFSRGALTLGVHWKITVEDDDND